MKATCPCGSTEFLVQREVHELDPSRWRWRTVVGALCVCIRCGKPLTVTRSGVRHPDWAGPSEPTNGARMARRPDSARAPLAPDPDVPWSPGR